MEITGIQQTKKGRFSIFVDGEFLFSLHPDILAASHLGTGDAVTPERLEELHRESELRITKERALRLLSARSYTVFGLRQKLLQYADEECAQAAVDRMEELGLLDDRDYARRFAADAANLKGHGPGRITRVLREKGVSKDIVEQVLMDMEEDPEPAIARIVLRKYSRYLDDAKGVEKTMNALARLGYRFGDIRQVLANLAEDPAYYDEY